MAGIRGESDSTLDIRVSENELNRHFRSKADRGVRVLHPMCAMLLGCCLCVAASSTRGGPALESDPYAADADQHGDIVLGVVMDAAEQSGHASATVRIHASRETIWPLLTSCRDALAIVPGLAECQVLETSHDGSSQRIRHVLNYSWYLPKLIYELRATYDKPRRVTLDRISGDLKTLNVSWTLRAEGDFTVAQYVVDLAPGFWVPHWLVRVALRRDLPRMLRAVRSRAEAAAAR